jgi:hypothetical protein
VLRVRPTDIPDNNIVFAPGRIPIRFLIHGEAEAAGLVDDGPAKRIAPLSYAAGKHERVHLPPQRHVVAANVAADAVDEEVEREPAGGLLVAVGGDVAEVGRPRQRPPPALLVEDLLRPGYVEVLRRRWRERVRSTGIMENKAAKDERKR